MRTNETRQAHEVVQGGPRTQFCNPVRVSIINDSKPHRRWIKDDHCYAVLMNQILKPSGKFSSVLFVIKAAKAVAPTAFCRV